MSVCGGQRAALAVSHQAPLFNGMELTDWLAGYKPQELSSLDLSSAGVTGMHHHAQFRVGSGSLIFAR